MRAMQSIRSLFFAALLFAIPAASFAQISVGIAVRVAPPEIPVYEQPECPGEGYIWTPGYWAYGDDDYYWVPGTWVEAPTVGYLWTPGYWGWSDGGYRFHGGYWGPHVGFYGGINYGFGYTGSGYYGGRWDHGHFAYNRSVNRVNVTIIHNTYNTRIVNRNTTRVSYNGGRGGIRARETARDRQVAREHHIERTNVQTEHIQAAKADRSQFSSVNHGRPAVAATPRPGAFNDRAVSHAKEAPAARGRGNDRAGAAANTNTHVNGNRADRPANATNNAVRSNTARTDRPSNATKPNTARETGSNRNDRPSNAGSAKSNNTSRGAAADRPAAHSNASKPERVDRPARASSSPSARPADRAPRAERPAPTHSARPEHVRCESYRSTGQRRRSEVQQHFAWRLRRSSGDGSYRYTAEHVSRPASHARERGQARTCGSTSQGHFVAQRQTSRACTSSRKKRYAACCQTGACAAPGQP